MVMRVIQHTSADTIDIGGIACEYLRSPRRLREMINTDKLPINRTKLTGERETRIHWN